MALRLQARLPLPIVCTRSPIARVKLSIASKSLLKGRPTGTGENEYFAIHVERPSHSAALSGRVPCGKNPGLKPCAKICNRRAVKSDRHLVYPNPRSLGYSR